MAKECSKYPKAIAILQQSTYDQTVNLWIVPKCPLCGKKHSHGGGGPDDDPRRLLGHRVAHCWSPKVPDEARSRGYILVESVSENSD